jgi:hypothetical protein
LLVPRRGRFNDNRCSLSVDWWNCLDHSSVFTAAKTENVVPQSCERKTRLNSILRS